MAEWSIAYNRMMDSEDAPRAYRKVPDCAPRGVAGPCFAISGINSAVFPREFAAIAACEQAKRGALVEAFYCSHFWNAWLERMKSDEVAARVFDYGVNAGQGTAVRALQQALNARAGIAHLAEDGRWGEQTLAAANAAEEHALVAAFVEVRVEHYRRIASSDAGKAQYLAAWVARARR